MEYKAQYQEYLLQATAALDAASARFLPEESEVCRAARYSLLGGGKRIRAILTLSVCDMLGGEMQAAAQFAAAVEMLHCYSLIHDDLPCMDNDDLRRGRPSCHKAFSESTAMLAGDVLLTEAFEVIANAPAAPQICVAAARALGAGAGSCGMVYGQELDLKYEALAATEEQLRLIHRNKTGGHLASNLGTVELTVALHRVLETPKDKIVFDVGHQCYTHKLLTGRRKQFDHLRQLDGISGFPNPNESVHDAFIAGHGNTALSLAIGMAWAKKIKHEPGLVVALIGDGAFTGGMVYEGMNNIGGLDNLLVILNDNKMSISKNVGALARYLTHLRTTTAYYDAKDNVRSFLDGVPLIGPPMKKSLMGAKTLVRRAMYHSTMFEDMGFEYIGPVDGHNVEELERTLRSIYQRPGPHFLHVVTKKGKGYQPAEMNPGNYHGVSAFDPDGMPDPEVAPKESFSTVFGKLLVQEGTQNPKLCAITAAMKYGTGLQFFAHRHPQRFFDVGMAEQHAVTFAAGLASQGMLPVVCIYSTFLQRSYDQIIHDVNLLKENVLFAIDRAGFVPADGETHQGIYDAAFLSQLNIPVYAPSNYEELQYWLHYLLQDTISGPRAIRYPRGGENTKLAQYPCTKQEYDFLQQLPGAEILLVSYADELEDLLEAADQLNAASQNSDVLKLVKLYPFTDKLIDAVSKYKIVLFAEECVAAGGIGEHLAYALQQNGWNGRFLHCAVRTACLPHATVPQIKQCTGLDAADIVQAVRAALTKGENEL